MNRPGLSRQPRGAAAIVAVALVSVAFALHPAHAAKRGNKSVDRVVTRAMDIWRVPGLAVAAIRRGKVVYQKAFGVADIDSQRPVTSRTLFATGSITKSFTVTALAMLADEGRFDWDRPVKQYLTEFRLKDDAASRTVTPRDLVTHRSGMPRHDVLWYAGVFTRPDMVRRLRYLEPTTKPREAFQYNNLMYMTAGYLAGRLDGGTWETVTRRRILEPLGMASTRVGFVRFLSSRNWATPYFGAMEGRVPIAARNTDPVGPAAAVYSNIEDMIRYVRFHLNAGVHNGRRLLSPRSATEIRTPHIKIPRRRRFDELGPVSYGMGFYVSSYRGRTLVFHSGFIDGYGGLLALLPDDRIGVIVLTNLSGHNPVPKIVARTLFDRLLRLKPLPWLGRFHQIEEARERRRRRRERARAAPTLAPATTEEPPPVPRPKPRPAKAYAGIYDHPGYGPIEIWAEDDRIAGRFHLKVFPLVRVDGDVWRVPETVWPIRAGLQITFEASADGSIDRLATPIADGPTYPFKVGDVVFYRATELGSE